MSIIRELLASAIEYASERIAWAVMSAGDAASRRICPPRPVPAQTARNSDLDERSELDPR